MTYDEYMECANKHLDAVKGILGKYESNENDLNSNLPLMLDIYYLCGYILEGVVVYSAYRSNGWISHEDIKTKYNVVFTIRTNLDFFYNRKVIIRRNGGEIDITPLCFQNRPSGALSVQGHNFQEISKNLLRNNPTFNGVPYIGNNRNIDPDIEQLIDHWNPAVRYMHLGSQGLPNLNIDVIKRLFDTCSTIYILITRIYNFTTRII